MSDQRLGCSSCGPRWSLPVAGLIMVIALGCDDGAAPRTVLQGSVTATWWDRALPIGGATVRAEGASVRSASTDESGQFVFDGLSPGSYSLYVTPLFGFLFEDTLQVTLAQGEDRSLELSGTRTSVMLEGTASYLPRGGGAGEATFVVSAAGASGAVEVTTGPDGSFSTELPWGAYRVVSPSPETFLIDPESLAIVEIPTSGMTGLEVGLRAIVAQTATVDFETPTLTLGGQEIDPYVHEESDIWFTAADVSTTVETVGVVLNGQTSACVPPDMDGQRLGTGSEGTVGFSAFPVVAEPPALLPVGSQVEVDVQAVAFPATEAVMVLFDVSGQPVDSVGATIPEVGVCSSNVGNPRGRVRLTATAGSPVSRVQIRTEPDGRVTVIDDFRVTAPGR